MIIGFIGLAQSGKTTAAEHLQKEHHFVRINFKDALVSEMKQNLMLTMNAMVDSYNTLDYDGMDPWTIDKLFRVKPPMFRALMQNYGTEVRRNDDEYYWVQQWAKKASNVTADVVVDDVRFKNEANCVRNAGGKLIRIKRTDQEGSMDHSSETEMANINHDFTIKVGPGEIEDLLLNVSEHVRILKAEEKEVHRQL